MCKYIPIISVLNIAKSRLFIVSFILWLYSHMGNKYVGRICRSPLVKNVTWYKWIMYVRNLLIFLQQDQVYRQTQKRHCSGPLESNNQVNNLACIWKRKLKSFFHWVQISQKEVIIYQAMKTITLLSWTNLSLTHLISNLGFQCVLK